MTKEIRKIGKVGFLTSKMTSNFGDDVPYLKKHIKNARDLEGKRNKDIIISIIKNWVLSECELPEEMIEQLVWQCIARVIKDMEWNEDFQELLISALLYGTKVVKTNGKLVAHQVPGHLAVSFTLAIKFLEDQPIDMNFVSQSLGLSKKDMNFLERKFLTALDYNLYMNKEERDILKKKPISFEVLHTSAS